MSILLKVLLPVCIKIQHKVTIIAWGEVVCYVHIFVIAVAQCKDECYIHHDNLSAVYFSYKQNCGVLSGFIFILTHDHA